MSVIDMVFEGGGAKGMVFVGALEVLLRGGEHSIGRLLGTSAGAITAALLAARYSVEEMQVALVEKDAAGRPVFESFLGQPGPFDADTVKQSAVRRFLRDLDLPGVPEFAEQRIDDFIATRMASGGYPAHFFSFVENGGWYKADAFVEWMTRKLNEGIIDGKERRFGNLSLRQLFEETGVDVTLVAADTTAQRVLLLNHRTAPDCPIVWAARMSMSIPLLWQEVIWQKEWGLYQGEEITGTIVVDGGMLSNFPIALFLSARPEVGDVVGPPATKNVLGFLIDDKIDVPGLSIPDEPSGGIHMSKLTTVQRLSRLVQTMTSAHDNMAIAVFQKHVVHLPARGVGVIQFDMPDAVREALVAGGRTTMADFLSQQSVLESTGEPDFSAPPEAVNLADEAALQYLRVN